MLIEHKANALHCEIACFAASWSLDYILPMLMQTQCAAGAAVQPLLSRSKSHIYGSTSGAAAGSGGDEVSLSVSQTGVQQSAVCDELGSQRCNPFLKYGRRCDLPCKVWVCQ